MVQLTSLVRVHFRDNDGAEAYCQINFSSSVPAATLWTIAPTYAALIQAVSSAVCIGVDVILQFRQTSIGVPDPQSDVHRSGLFTINNAASMLYAFRIPSIADDFILSTGPFAGIAIDTVNSTVMALLSALINGISSVEPCDILGIDLIELSQAFTEQY